MDIPPPPRRARPLVALLAALTVAAGLLTRSGLPLPAPLRAYGGDTLYATLAFLLAALLWPGWPTGRLASLALLACVAVELSQLWRAPWLDALRSSLPGRLILGSGFLWSDLLCYAAGALLGALLDRAALRRPPAAAGRP